MMMSMGPAETAGSLPLTESLNLKLLLRYCAVPNTYAMHAIAMGRRGPPLRILQFQRRACRPGHQAGRRQRRARSVNGRRGETVRVPPLLAADGHTQIDTGSALAGRRVAPADRPW